MKVSIKKLTKNVVTPFEELPWCEGKPLTKDEIRAAIESGKFRNKPIIPWKNETHEKLMKSRTYHIQRVAYLAVNGWSDMISIDVGIPSLGYYPSEYILDGWHRFAAAIYRKDKTIECECGGEEKEIRKLK